MGSVVPKPVARERVLQLFLEAHAHVAATAKNGGAYQPRAFVAALSPLLDNALTRQLVLLALGDFILQSLADGSPPDLRHWRPPSE